MHESYEDIRSRIIEPPKWFDEHAVPRYDDFTPQQVADIYASEAALVEIACQACGRRYLVAFSETLSSYQFRSYNYLKSGGMKEEDWKTEFEKLSKHPLADDITDGSIHYGDPPNDHNCAGVTMNCDDIRVCEYWRRDKFQKWIRDERYEIVLDSVYESEKSKRDFPMPEQKRGLQPATLKTIRTVLTYLFQRR